MQRLLHSDALQRRRRLFAVGIAQFRLVLIQPAALVARFARRGRLELRAQLSVRDRNDRHSGAGFNYTNNLYLQSSGTSVVLLSGQNTQETFNLSGGVYVPATGNNTAARLTRTGSGTSADQFTLTSSQGTVSTFYGFYSGLATPGRLQSIQDRLGNKQTYTWVNTGGIDQLQSVTDSYGRTITYTYYGSESNYQLSQITDFLGRQLNFQYDSAARLVAVVTPSILQAAAGNTFPGGTAYVFEYDSNNPRPQRQNDLIKVWYPNQTQSYLDTATRTVDVAGVYSGAAPRYNVAYGQDPTDTDLWGRVLSETVGDPEQGVGGTYNYLYTSESLPTNLIDSGDPIVFQATMTDRNGNQSIYDFNANQMPSCVTVMRTRSKIDIPPFSGGGGFASYVTWTKYNANNQPLVVVYPEGNSTQYTYDTGVISGISGVYSPRLGLLLSETRLPGNSIGIASRAGSNGQYQLQRTYFYDPLFNQQCAMIEERGNPIELGSPNTYFTPQNGGTTPTDSSRSRYATIPYFDYQKDTQSTVDTNSALQTLLGGLSSGQIDDLITYASGQMTAGGIAAGFPLNLGPINGDGTGNGASSGLPSAAVNGMYLGNAVAIVRPAVTLVQSGSTSGWTPNQTRIESFTTNARGQSTTHTDTEGNLTVMVRYPLSNPEGSEQFEAPGLGNKQYGQLKEIHVDADPNDVLSLVGADGDLVDFNPGQIPSGWQVTRTNTPGVYQDLVTRYEGSTIGTGGTCTSCAYDPLGNPLAMTDPRGFTTRFDRNELGELYRTTSPQPYLFQVENQFDANRNTVRVDTQDMQPLYGSSDPTSACFAQFTPSGSGSTAQVPMQPGPGGTVRAGWFTNLYTFDLLNNLVEQDLDATGSTPASLVSTYLYDPNQNLVQVTRPNGNIVEYDYDERNLRIAQRVGMSIAAGEPGAVTITAYDANGNVLQMIGPAARGSSGNQETVILEDAFRSGVTLTHTGDFALANTYDGFNRVTSATDAVGGVTNNTFDPGNRLVAMNFNGTIGGSTPTDRSGSANEQLSSSAMFFDEAARPYEQQQFAYMATGTTVPSGRSITHTGGGLLQNSTANTHTGTVTISASPGPGSASYVLTRTVYDRAGRTAALAQDLQPSTSSTAETSYAFDGANRKIEETDALGNFVQYTLDPAGNVTLVTRTEVCTITSPTVSNEIFQSAAYYDCLGRQVMSAQQGPDGNLDVSPVFCGSDALWQVPGSALLNLAAFDSRGNRVLSLDPKGNTSVMVFDGASRRLQTIQHLRQAGQGQNGPVAGSSLLPFTAGSMTTTQVLDGNGNLIQLIDDRGDVTGFTYDTMDRQTVMTFHDGSTRVSVYDEASDVVTYTDENGSVFTSTFDPLGRKTAVSISLASGVAGTTAQSFQHDGLSRMTFARDSLSSTNADVTLVYDSLSRVLEESHGFGGNTRNVTHAAFTSTPVSGFTFPQGRQLTNTYDVLYRRTLVEDVTNSVNIAAWQFFGPSRVAEVTLGNGLICTWMNNARTHSAVQPSVSNPSWGNQSSDRLGYDGSGRPTAKRFLAGGINGTTHAYNTPSSVVGFTTAYDPSSNKLYERALHCESRDSLYQAYSATIPQAGCYDSLDRLLQYQRGVLSSTGGPSNLGGGSITTPISLSNTNTQQTYTLDGLGNWRRTGYTPVGGSLTTQVRQHNGLNEITRVSISGNNTNFSYDGTTGHSNGNLANDGTLRYTWDALNRLVEVQNAAGTTVFANYYYDALGRRIRKVVQNGGLPGNSALNGTVDCLYSGWRCVEDRDGSNNPLKQYTWGTYLDELLQQYNIAAINNFGTDAALYPLPDLLYRTTGLADSSGVIREAYDTDAYGNTLIFRNSGSPPSAIGWTSDTAVTNATCEFIFTGQRFDAETSQHYFKSRTYTPAHGRFTSRDGGSQRRATSLFSYVLGRAASWLDPLGRDILDPYGSFYGGEFILLLGAGVTAVSCKDEKGCPKLMLFVKVCGSPLPWPSVGGTVGAVAMGGQLCDPETYKGWFFEFGAVSPTGVGVSADISPSGVAEGGVTAGLPGVKAAACYYWYLGTEAMPAQPGAPGQAPTNPLTYAEKLRLAEDYCEGVAWNWCLHQPRGSMQDLNDCVADAYADCMFG